MNTAQIHDLISENTKGLPQELLEEVLDFIQFIKAKKLIARSNYSYPTFADTSASEEQHLMDEFADYKTTYPHE
jgi:hypothetical protein